MLNPNGTVVALDVGIRRIGVARASVEAGIAAPLTTLHHDEAIMHTIVNLLAEHETVALVVGLPRGLDGQDTAQTRVVEAFAAELKKHTDVPMYWQDEAVTSRKAEEELEGRGKPYGKGDIDALAATYILEDFLREHAEEVRS
jgi:putative holliday junction resolvase